VDDAGAVYVTGDTESFDFPATPGDFDTTRNGDQDAFVAKLTMGRKSEIYFIFLPAVCRTIFVDKPPFSLSKARQEGGDTSMTPHR